MILQNDLFNQAHSIAKKWGSKAFFSFLDQGIYSGTNFTINILLARWLSPASYGAFAVAFSIYIFLSGFQNALILEPMAVYGSSRHRYHISDYVKILTWLQLAINVILAFMVRLVAPFFNTELRVTLNGLSISIPFMLLVWLYRRVFYIELKPNLAIRVSAIYAIFLYIGTFGLYITKTISPDRIFMLMGSASAVASVYAWSGIPERENKIKQIKSNIKPKDIILENWKYGHWMLGTTIAYGVSNYLYAPIIGVFLSLSDVAAFRAMENFLLPIQQVIAATTLLALPYLSNLIYENGVTRLKQVYGYYITIIVVITFIYTLTIFLFRFTIIRFFYQSQFYEEYIWLLPFLLGSFLISTVSHSFGVLIKSFEKPEGVWWAKLFSSIFFLTFGIFTIYLLKLSGVIVTKYLIAVLDAFTLVFIFRWFLKKKDKIS